MSGLGERPAPGVRPFLRALTDRELDDLIATAARPGSVKSRPAPTLTVNTAAPPLPPRDSHGGSGSPRGPLSFYRTSVSPHDQGAPVSPRGAPGSDASADGFGRPQSPARGGRQQSGAPTLSSGDGGRAEVVAAVADESPGPLPDDDAQHLRAEVEALRRTEQELRRERDSQERQLSHLRAALDLQTRAPTPRAGALPPPAGYDSQPAQGAPSSSTTTATTSSRVGPAEPPAAKKNRLQILVEEQAAELERRCAEAETRAEEERLRAERLQDELRRLSEARGSRAELEETEQWADVAERRLAAEKSRGEALRQRESRLQALVSELLESGSTAKAAGGAASSDRLLRSLITPELLRESEPPPGFPVPGPLSFTEAEFQRVRQRAIVLERECAELRGQVENLTRANAELRTGRAAEQTRFQNQLRQQQNHLVGAVRRVKWLLEEKEKSEQDLKVRLAYTSQLEEALLARASPARQAAPAAEPEPSAIAPAAAAAAAGAAAAQEPQGRAQYPSRGAIGANRKAQQTVQQGGRAGHNTVRGQSPGRVGSGGHRTEQPAVPSSVRQRVEPRATRPALPRARVSLDDD